MPRRVDDKKREPSFQDRLMADWTAAGRKAGVAYLKEKVLGPNPHRLLRTLEPFEFDGLVLAVMEAVDTRRRKLSLDEKLLHMDLDSALKEFDYSKGDTLEGVFPE